MTGTSAQVPFITKVDPLGSVPTRHIAGALSPDGKLAQLGAFQAPVSDFTVAVYDSLSHFLWGRRLSPVTVGDAMTARTIAWTVNGDLVVVGQTTSSQAQVSALRFGPTGDLLWSNMYTVGEDYSLYTSPSCVLLEDGGIILGEVRNGAPVVVKLGSGGQIDWAHGFQLDAASSPLPLASGPNSELIVLSCGYEKTTLTILDSMGALISETYLPGVPDRPISIVDIGDGNFVLAGRNGDSPAAALVNAQGLFVWAKEYHYPTPFYENLTRATGIEGGVRLHVTKSVFGGSNALALDVNNTGAPVTMYGFSDGWLTDEIPFASTLNGMFYCSGYLYPPSWDGGIQEAYCLVRSDVDMQLPCGTSTLAVTTVDIPVEPLDSEYVFQGMTDELITSVPMQLTMLPLTITTEDACAFFSAVAEAEPSITLVAMPTSVNRGEQVRVQFDRLQHIGLLTCLAADGRVVATLRVPANAMSIELETGLFSSGLYLVRASDSEGKTAGVCRIIVE